MKLLRLVSCLLLNCLVLGTANAEILTDQSQLSANNTLINFNSLTPGVLSNPFTVGDATFSSPMSLSIVNTSPYLSTPEVNGMALVSSIGGLSSPFADLRIDFSTAVSEIGLGWWDSNNVGNELRVFDSANNLLEFAAMPTGQTGGVFGTFRGIRRSSADIAYAVAHVSNSDDYYGIDNVSFGITAVPEPSSGILLGIATVGLLSRYRRARSNRQA